MQHGFASRRDHDVHAPAIGRGMNASDKSGFFHPVEQTDRGMMLDLERLGDLANGCRLVADMTTHGNEELMLLWGETGFPRRFLAESQEAA
jgi:hypothetical protein